MAACFSPFAVRLVWVGLGMAVFATRALFVYFIMLQCRFVATVSPTDLPHPLRDRWVPGAGLPTSTIPSRRHRSTCGPPQPGRWRRTARRLSGSR